MIRQRFEAPWSTAVKVVSGGATLLLVGVAAALWQSPVTALASVLPLAILVGAALFTVRGYGLEPGALVVERLLWSTRIELGGPVRAWADPEAMRRSWRVFGNGGMYSITGHYRNKTLGSYRAWAMDPKRAVVLETTDRRLVVTPDDPAAFLASLEALGFLAPGPAD